MTKKDTDNLEGHVGDYIYSLVLSFVDLVEVLMQ